MTRLKTTIRIFSLVAAGALLAQCGNSPYRPGEGEQNWYYYLYWTSTAKLDPAVAYYTHERGILDQVYESPFDYHYLKRPYELIPRTAVEIPEPIYFDKEGRRLEEADPSAETVGRVEYVIRLKPGTMYQNHPCFAKDAAGNFLNRDLTAEDVKDFAEADDFPQQGTRELVARDYVLQVRRLADPRLDCPIRSTMGGYIAGLNELHDAYKKVLEGERARRREKIGAHYSQERDEKLNPIALDHFSVEFAGAQVIDRYTYKIVLKRKFPQMLYWLVMPFFCAMPQEALDFYNQPVLIEKQINLMRGPVGTGPYYVKEFQPNERYILVKNPNYRPDFYPTEGDPGDREAGLLEDAGKRLPFIERQVMIMEKEAIPRWAKFMQGYYDVSLIYSDVFDQAIQVTQGQDPSVSEMMKEKEIELLTTVDTTVYYLQFNMLDDEVGGYTPEKQKLRQALSIVQDYNEYLDIFVNGRGIPSHAPIPPGIFGYREGKDGVNPFISDWDETQQRHKRKPLEVAKQLMKEAGYPDGLGPDGKPLTLYYDHGSVDIAFRSIVAWTAEKFSLLGVRLVERQTEFSRMREKILKGNWQIANGGWLADYPDPENFLFLFYGPNGKVKGGGENASNYDNPRFNELFLKMESMRNSPERQAIIDEMVRIVQEDSPAAWMYHPLTYTLRHDWYRNVKPHVMTYNLIKYHRIDAAQRVARQQEWNRPNYWPLILLAVLLVFGTIPAAIAIRRRERGR